MDNWKRGGGGEGAIKAELLCRLVLPFRTCSPFKEGLLHSSVGGLVVHPLGWVWRGRVQSALGSGGMLGSAAFSCARPISRPQKYPFPERYRALIPEMG